MEQECMILYDRLWEEHCCFNNSIPCVFLKENKLLLNNLSDTCQGWLNEFGDLVDRPDEPWMEYECHDWVILRVILGHCEQSIEVKPKLLEETCEFLSSLLLVHS